MSDRREDLTTANVKCYIYNSKTDIPVADPIIVPIENTGTLVTTGTTLPITPGVITPEIPAVVVPIPPIVTPELPIVIVPPQEPAVVVPSTPIIIPQITDNKNIVLELSKLSDIAQHFMTQNDLVVSLVSKSPLKLGEVALLTIEIKDKKTGELYSGLLPFSFSILSTNDSIQSDISNIHIINDGTVTISLLGQKIGTASIVIVIDDIKIGNFSLDVK
jgi:hypothetical protein